MVTFWHIINYSTASVFLFEGIVGWRPCFCEFSGLVELSLYCWASQLQKKIRSKSPELAMGAACAKGDAGGNEFVVEKSENLLHQKRVYPPREIIPPLPELKDFKDVPKKTSRRQGIFEDEEFPATNASIGGVTGDNANPNVAQYLEAGTVPKLFS